jgi:hypothetical protein
MSGETAVIRKVYGLQIQGDPKNLTLAFFGENFSKIA